MKRLRRFFANQAPAPAEPVAPVVALPAPIEAPVLEPRPPVLGLVERSSAEPVAPDPVAHAQAPAPDPVARGEAPAPDRVARGEAPAPDRVARGEAPAPDRVAPGRQPSAGGGDEPDTKAVLTAALESLGKAHHRPYSRAGARRRKT